MITDQEICFNHGEKRRSDQLCQRCETLTPFRRFISYRGEVTLYFYQSISTNTLIDFFPRNIMRAFVLVPAFVFAICLATSFCSIGSAQLPTGWKAHDLKRPQPTVVTPAKEVGGAPSDAVVLVDGKDMSQWRSGNGKPSKWKVVDGAMEAVPKSGYVFSKEEFGDC